MKTNIIPFQSQPKTQHSRKSRSGAAFRGALLLATGILVVGTLALSSCGGKAPKGPTPRFATEQEYLKARRAALDTLSMNYNLSESQKSNLTRLVNSVGNDSSFRLRGLTEADIFVTLILNRNFLKDEVKQKTVDHLFEQEIKKIRGIMAERIAVQEATGGSARSIQKTKDEFNERIEQVMRVWAVVSAYKSQLSSVERAELYLALPVDTFSP